MVSYTRALPFGLPIFFMYIYMYMCIVHTDREENIKEPQVRIYKRKKKVLRLAFSWSIAWSRSRFYTFYLGTSYVHLYEFNNSRCSLPFSEKSFIREYTSGILRKNWSQGYCLQKALKISFALLSHIENRRRLCVCSDSKVSC